jgi:uncharacterized membrane protein
MAEARAFKAMGQGIEAMSKDKLGVGRASVRLQPSVGRKKTWPLRELGAVAATIGVVGAGAVLLEAALAPSLLLFGAAALAPRYAPKLRRRLQPLLKPSRRPALPRPEAGAPVAPVSFALKEALAKTVTFRIVVTGLDFTWNYVLLRDAATAAGLSSIPLVTGPVLYFIHETAWNRFGSAAMSKLGLWRPAAELARGADERGLPQPGQGQFVISRALAKTITFRTLGTTMELTTNYLVVGDLATAAALSAFGLFAGPFIYLGHEMAWDRRCASQKRALPPPAEGAPAAT